MASPIYAYIGDAPLNLSEDEEMTEAIGFV